MKKEDIYAIIAAIAIGLMLTTMGITGVQTKGFQTGEQIKESHGQ